MTALQRTALSFLVALLVWAFFSWPVPRVMTSGVACASLNVEKGSARAMMPGDHLQFLYQFWLTADTLRGHAPAFVNPYEFNIGDDEAGRFRGTYYVPFSLFYAVGAAWLGPAFGYNFDHLVTLWLTFLFLWMLVRRYCRDDGLAAVAALVGLGIPYAWITMLDGSPTGLAMMWVPLIYWALDVMVVERKIWAGALAGIGICLAESDSHVFFFAILSSPVWCGLSYLFHFRGARPWRGELRSLSRAALMLILFLGVAVWQTWVIRHSIQETTLVVASRSIEEIRAGSPALSGLVKLHNPGDSRKIYVGGYLVFLLAAGALAFLRGRKREGQGDGVPLPALMALGAVMVGVALLATGTMNPLGPRAWKVVMTLIPPYAVIRQPHKIFCLMPSFVALASGLLLPCLLARVRGHWRVWVAFALVVPLLLDYGFRIRPTLCILDRGQGAFKAVAEDARAAGNTRPHLLSLPIWPGDSHYDSLNEYYVSLYGLRMVNGYGGSVKSSYLADVFGPLESMNLGVVTAAQLDFLLSRGVGYLVLHEDCFPEKVAPFPIGVTLESLLNHPRLLCIGKEAAMWAFRIQPAGQEVIGRKATHFMTTYCCARQYEFESLVPGTVTRPALLIPAGSPAMPEACNGVRLAAAGDAVALPPSLTTVGLPLSWTVRVKGQGRVEVATISAGKTNAPTPLAVDSGDWVWKSIGIPGEAAGGGVSAQFTWGDGTVDLDKALLTAGEWEAPAVGAKVTLPAACFFHAGYTDKSLEWVVLRAAYEPDSIVFYGPKLPLEKGRYAATLVFESDAPAGTLLGQINIRWTGAEDQGWVPVRQGSPSVVRFEQKENLPFFLAFEFHRSADIRIRSVELSRLE